MNSSSTSSTLSGVGDCGDDPNDEENDLAPTSVEEGGSDIREEPSIISLRWCLW